MSKYTLFQGDCLDILPTLEAGSVDAVICDPPYYNVVNEDWDKQWDGIVHYQDWIAQCAEQIKRVLKNNGSFYIFTDDKIGAYVQVELDRYFLLLNNLVWYKTNNLPIKNVFGLRSWATMTERILFYTPQPCRTGWETIKLDTSNFKPLRNYFEQYQRSIGLSLKKINEALGHRKAEHAFYWGSTQWDLPTEETYKQLAEAFPHAPQRREYEDLRREYEDLRREYEDLRREYEDLRRTWNTDGQTLDVITGNIVTAKENTAHPTTKPLWLMNRLIETCTNEGDTVLDFTMGSGTTGVAAMRTGRNFIGIELDKNYFAIAEERIKNAAGDFTLTSKEKEAGMRPLFANV